MPLVIQKDERGDFVFLFWNSTGLRDIMPGIHSCYGYLQSICKMIHAPLTGLQVETVH